MKRLSILFAAIALFSFGSYASDEYNVLWALNNNSTSSKVKEYVKATPEQSELLNKIFYDSTQKLADALSDNDKDAAQKALYFNIANVKSVLSQKQFRKYLEILNATYNQRSDTFASTVSK